MRRPLVLVAAAALAVSCSSDPAMSTKGPESSESQPSSSGNPTASGSPSAPSSQPSESSPSSSQAPAAAAKAGAGLYGLGVRSLEGEAVELGKYGGSVSLVVNVASQCGYTKQYAGLQKLHAEFASKGFQVLGFPSNDFGGQEPGSAMEIRKFCSDTYSVDFPMFEKVATKGESQSPVYAALASATGEVPSWNFCKYLVGKDGTPIAFYKSSTKPGDAALREAIEAALAQ